MNLLSAFTSVSERFRRHACYRMVVNLRHVLLDTLVHLPPQNIVADLTEDDAMSRNGNAPQSIADILAHMNFWQAWFLQRCRGQAEPMAASAAVGWPGIRPGGWNALREKFFAGLEQAAAYADDAGRLTQRIDPALEFPPMADYTVADVLVHVANHNAHHFGQIITLRQISGLWPPPSGGWTW